MSKLLILLLPLVLIGGIAGGLSLAWGPLANAPSGASPATLRRSEKEAYIDMVAAAYAVEQDVRAARERLDLLNAGTISTWVTERAQAAATNNEGLRAYRLANLALALQGQDVQDPQLQALAQPSQLESKQWRWMTQRTLLCNQLTELADQPFLRLRVENARALPMSEVSAKLTLYEGSEITLRTNAQGIAQAPFWGEGVITFPDGMTIPVYAPGLQKTCAADTPTLPHAVEIVVRSK